MTTIITKNSSTAGAAPTAGDLVQGELAVNVTDKALYTENASGTVVKLNTPSIVDNGNATAITIDSSENVGVGVTPSAWSGFTAFQVSNAMSLWSSSGGNAYLNNNTYYDGTARKYVFTGAASEYVQSGGSHAWKIAPSGTAGNAITFTQAMTLDASGNLGIVSTAPSTDGVSGYANLVIGSSSASASGITMRTNNSGSTTQGVIWARGTGGANGFVKYDHYNDALTLGSGGSERARIDSSGNLLVGTTSLIGSSEVAAFSKAAGAANTVIAKNTSGSGNVGGIGVQFGSNGNNTSSWFFQGTCIGVANYYLYGNGTSSFTSDERKKKNIETTRNGYAEDLCRLRVVKYNWLNDDDDTAKELGLIAQEVEQVFPGLVQDDPTPDEDGTVYKTLKASVLPFMLLKAIQEQQALIASQSEIITQLQADVAALKAA